LYDHKTKLIGQYMNGAKCTWTKLGCAEGKRDRNRDTSPGMANINQGGMDTIDLTQSDSNNHSGR
jgi:hypothetical protein